MLEELIRKPNTKENNNAIIDFVGSDRERFAALMNHFITGGVRVSQSTSWALGYIGERQPILIEPYHELLVEKLIDKSQIGAVRRNIVRIYQTCDISENLEGKLYESCMNYILDPTEAIAVKAFSMSVCERIALKYPDLIPELIDAIASVLPTGSSGVKNRGQKIINRLTKKVHP